MLGAAIALLVAQATPAVGLHPLVPRPCDWVEKSHGFCDSDVFKPVWRDVYPGRPLVTKIDMASVQATPGDGASVAVYVAITGTQIDMGDVHHFVFDCKGRYSDMAEAGTVLPVLPGAAPFEIQRLVCPIAHAKYRQIRAQQGF